VNIVERLLAREEIDSLELELARAREAHDEGAISELGARIARLEMALAFARRGNVRSGDGKPSWPLQKAA